MNNEPKVTDDAMYRLLREGNVESFNAERSKGVEFDLTGCDFRGVNLRGVNADGLDFSNCYFRQADLRGLDLSNARLEGASIHGARISGARFPNALRADEITMSLVHGTRMRYRK
ncbi:MAG: pentapeptide repeat-containing protein [Acidiferrobacterales bacterium]|jgi:uncharacterized protein YjbI with pentapeptide repeats|nr:pentapeptide repeat-containing protein [Acidiferrobacterales bacterium]